MKLRRVSELFGRLVVFACKEQCEIQSGDDDGREWIFLLGLFGYGDRLIRPAHRHQVLGIPVICDRMTGIEFKSTLEFFFEAGPVPVMQSDVSQRGVSLAQRIIYLKSLPRCGLCLQKPLPGSYDSSQREQRIRV